jgi:GNAT superfamily N-acetyltransferase
MDYNFRKATLADVAQIWKILQDAILRRKEEGSQQWQDGYPNLQVVERDMASETGFVLADGDAIIAYCAILLNNEPAYANIDGKWLSDGDFLVVHRVAVANNYLGKGMAKRIFQHIEDYAASQQVYSIKADTNFDNHAMIKIFEKMGYTYCGEVFFRGAARKAYEKVFGG